MEAVIQFLRSPSSVESFPTQSHYHQLSAAVALPVSYPIYRSRNLTSAGALEGLARCLLEVGRRGRAASWTDSSMQHWFLVPAAAHLMIAAARSCMYLVPGTRAIKLQLIH